MNITDIRIRKTYQDETRLRALVSITIDDDLAIHDMKIIQGEKRLFVAMPSRREPSGIYKDIVHPIGEKAREAMEEKIIAAYNEHLEEVGQQPQSEDDNFDAILKRVFGEDTAPDHG